LSWTQDGTRNTRLLRVAYIWIRKSGRWQAAYVQLTRVPP
jgi:hypothetical protein